VKAIEDASLAEMNEFEKTFVRLGIAIPYIFLPVAISSISLKGEQLSIFAITFTIFLHVWFILYAKKSKSITVPVCSM